jgi:exopolysaccharide biosynthesis predicted pyruvyltransferase EpsI
MNIKSSKVFALFKEYSNKNIIFIQPKGNWGDVLIFKGAEKLADLANVQYKSISCEEFKDTSFTEDHILYIFGNGGFNDIWDGEHINAFSKAVSTHPGVVILGPTTFFDDSDFLQKKVLEIFKNIKAKKIYMFSRGIQSYKSLENKLPKEVVFELEHDTALNIERIDLPPTRIQGKGKLYAIRNDKEATKIIRFNPFILWMDPVLFSKSFEEWFYIHDGVEEIITNRLHSAILGTILNKKVTLLANSYHKNSGLWEFSLKELGVQWKDNIQPEGLDKYLIQTNIYKWIANSYKFKHFVINSYLKKINLISK